MAWIWLGVAATVLLASRRGWLPGWLDAVVLCYALGLLAGNSGFALDEAREGWLPTAAVLLGIPLLLFSADFVAWLRLAPRTAGATALAFGCVCLTSALGALLFGPGAGPQGWIVAGMLAGTYTGSAPNLLAVGRALGAEQGLVTQVVASDLVVAGAFCLVLLSPLVRRLERWLPSPAPEPAPGPQPAPAAPAWRALPDAALAATLALLSAAAAGGAALLLPEAYQQLAALLGVTALGVAASLIPAVRALRSSPVLGEYWILVFCLAFGSLADLATLWSGWSAVFLWTAATLAASVALHWLLCRPLGIDRDTAVITTVAAIYGPALIPPVARNLRNPELILSGVTASLAGLAVGSYLGVGVAYVARALLS